MSRLVSLLLFLPLFHSYFDQGAKTEYPFSQWTVGTSGSNVTWCFVEDLDFNSSFIKAPEPDDWENWYRAILAYRDKVRSSIGRQEPYLRIEFPAMGDQAIHFDTFAYQLKLQPGEEFQIKGFSRLHPLPSIIYFDFDLKTRGEEQSYVVRKKIKATDSLLINPSEEWIAFSKTLKVPPFASDSFAIVPIMRFAPSQTETKIFIYDLRLVVQKDRKREWVRQNIDAYLAKQANNNQLIIPEELAWNNENFLMGLIFMWDHTFWSPEKGKYLVDSYCRKMVKEFGGLNSVILWHSYPNIGIDERNQFDFFDALPGGIAGLKQVVNDFHRNGVRVFLTYNPWDLDTRRPEKDDFQELAKIIDQTGADGIFLDTWRSAKGSISIFDTETSIRNEVARYHRAVAFSSEILPDFKDLFGPDAVTCSWGQEIVPFHYTDLSHQKWLMPAHKQHFVKRMAKDRKPILAHAWINGQGILLWENIFGTMNLWNATHRQTLRKMNAIWRAYGKLYISDRWKPFMPTNNKNVVASEWQDKGLIITNLVDTTAGTEATVKIEVKSGMNLKYFDLWNGEELKPFMENNKSYVNVKINGFGCLLQTGETNRKLLKLLQKQRHETSTPFSAKDEYDKEVSIKKPLRYDYHKAEQVGHIRDLDLLEIKGGHYKFTCMHIWREGLCYPNMDAKDNHDLVISYENGAQYIKHTHEETLPSFAIMTRVVTNRQFNEFLRSTGYKSRFPDNFLKHWNGDQCPDSLLDKPVVYVSLEDARAFAAWAGMRLPTEWEWQLAAETLGEEFIYNEVFEWNESERFDGYNRFVTLRGGCSRWLMRSSWWYLPGAPYGGIVGGSQSYNSHVKYFLMYPGMDRASTIGFRCIKIFNNSN
ncbi:MAG: formylglycine-generating enzyme family protein [candidate division KSB1 bacterium]|nr:formylglycine-generating enzyme family protein [candidate division KSB1 bacterium]